MNRIVITILLVGMGTAFCYNWRQDRWAVMDSLREIEPWFQRRWLTERRLQRFYQEQSWRPDSQGLRCVGRWSYGPSVKVSLRVTPEDTIICLARGSGASLIRFHSQDRLSFELLSDINSYGVVCRAIIMDTLVYCGMKQGGTGIEVWGVSNPEQPNRLSYIYLPPIMDIAVKDTLLFAIGYQQDSLRIFNVRDPRNPIQVGACADSGFPMCISGNYCYLADQYGLNIVDVSNPKEPHRVSSIGGFEALSVGVKDTLCYVSTYIYPDQFSLRVYNVRNPASPVPVGSLAGIEAPDIYFPPTCDTVLYTPKLHIINISDPRNPRQIGFADCPGWDYGVVTVPALNYALVADYFAGLVGVNITNPSLPVIDTAIYAAQQTLDIEIIDKETKLGILASYHAGMVLVDFTNPQMPQYLGCYDTVGSGAIVTSVTGCDSFAYISWPRPRLISIDISDPRHPVRAGGCENMFNPPEDMVLRDSFVYCAEANRFQVVNVARPRDPRLVGSCVVEEDAEGLCLVDSIAYVANYPFAIINVRQPSNPFIISRIWRGAWNGTVRDSFLFLSSGGVLVYSVADLRQPHLIDSLSVGPNTYWVEAVGSLLYTGNRDGVRVIDASDVHDMRVLGFCSAPYVVKRLAYVSPYLYAVCWDAGVCIFESTPIGVSELQSPQTAKGKLMVIPNPTRGRVRLAPRSNNWGLSQVIVRDALGREVAQIKCQRDSGECLKLNLNDLKRGLYFVEFVSEKQRAAVIVKIIKQ